MSLYPTILTIFSEFLVCILQFHFFLARLYLTIQASIIFVGFFNAILHIFILYLFYWYFIRFAKQCVLVMFYFILSLDVKKKFNKIQNSSL